MFDSYKIKMLNAKIETLEKRLDYQLSVIEGLGRPVVKVKVKTGKLINNFIYVRNETKSIPIDDVINLILDHLGLELKVIEALPETVELVKKSKSK